MGAAQGRGGAARRAGERALRALPDRRGQRPEGLDDPPHGPAGGPRPRADAPARRADARPGRRAPRRATTAGPIEIKWDGVRAIAYSTPGELRLESRNLNEITDKYPELAGLGRALGSRSAVLDGEIVAFDGAGRPSFATLQQRMQLTSRAQARRQMAATPVTYMIFDLLWLDGHSLMELPYAERRAALAELELGGESWQTPENVARPWTGAAAGQRRAGSRGDPRQAPGLDLPAGAAPAQLGQDQDRRSPGARRRRMAAGAGKAARADRRAAARGPRARRRPALRRPGRQRLQRGRARPARGPARAASERPRLSLRRRRAPAARGRLL